MSSATISGHVGKRGTIVLPAASRRRYGLDDGALFISEECADGILIRPAKAVATDLKKIREMIQEGLDELDQGKGIPGELVYAEMKKKIAEFRKSRKK